MKVFNTISDGLQWIMSNIGVGPSWHYLRNFRIVGLPQSCRELLQLAAAVCQELGVPLASDKLVGPATKLQFLGVTLDTESLELHFLSLMDVVKLNSLHFFFYYFFL